jgi:hypothetical protein
VALLFLNEMVGLEEVGEEGEVLWLDEEVAMNPGESAPFSRELSPLMLTSLQHRKWRLYALGQGISQSHSQCQLVVRDCFPRNSQWPPRHRSSSRNRHLRLCPRSIQNAQHQHHLHRCHLNGHLPSDLVLGSDPIHLSRRHCFVLSAVPNLDLSRSGLGHSCFF